MTDADGQLPRRVVAGEDEPSLAAYPPGELATISAADVARMPVKAPGPVTLQDRQGVFAHSFKCSICDLEFVIFSWRADRHRVGSTFCPECGKRTPMIHWRTQTSESLEFCSDGPGREIYQMFSPSDPPLMVDSVVPADDRYTFPNKRPDTRTLASRPTSPMEAAPNDPGIRHWGVGSDLAKAGQSLNPSVRFRRTGRCERCLCL
jgi:hypothetical protein